LIKPGTGEQITSEEATIEFHYVMCLQDGTKVSQSDLQKGITAKMRIDSKDLVPGISEGIKSMTKDERAKFTIQAEHAYGAQGNPSLAIPPNSTLIFQIWLVGFNQV